MTQINSTTIRLRSELADLRELLGGINSAVMLVTEHPLVDGKCLLKARDGLLILLEVGEQASEVVQCGRILWMIVAMQVAAVLNSFLVARDGLAPLLQLKVANAHVGQERPVLVPFLVLRQHGLGLVVDDQRFLIPSLLKVQPAQLHQHRAVLLVLLQAQFLHDGKRLPNGLARFG